MTEDKNKAALEAFNTGETGECTITPQGLVYDIFHFTEKEAEQIRSALTRASVADELDFPLGAIHNGRGFAEILENYGFKDSSGDDILNCYEWHEFKSCFEHLVEYAENLSRYNALKEKP